jgi:D-alanine-D-alanine ligase
MSDEEKRRLAGKRLLVISTGTPDKRFIFQKLKQLDLHIIIVHQGRNWATQFADEWIDVDVFNETQLFKALDDYVAKNPVDGIYSFREDNVTMVSKLVDRYGFVGIPYEISAKVRNKFLFREFCYRHGIAAPSYRFVKTPESLLEIDTELAYPLVLKPVMGASNAFVIKAETKDELVSSYHYIRNNISSATESAILDTKDVLVEEYIEGSEVDVDMIIQNGKTKFALVSDNFDKSKGKFFLDSGQCSPSSLPKSQQDELIELAEEVLEKLGVMNGCIHFEAKMTDDGPVPIELNLRMGGDYIYTSIKKSVGFDLIENAVKVALGEYIEPIKEVKVRKYVLGWDIHPKQSGIMSELLIDKDLMKEDYYEDSSFTKKVGDAVLIPPEGVDIMGWVVISGSSLIDAQSNLQDALELIRFNVTKFDNTSTVGQLDRDNSLTLATLRKQRFLQIARIESLNSEHLKVGVACNLFDPADGVVENDLSDIGQNIKTALESRGHEVMFFDFNDPAEAFNNLNRQKPDIVFNVCERINGSAMLEPHAAAILDVLRIPYTGCNPATLALCLDKIKSKKLLSYHNLPTPKWDYLTSTRDVVNDDLDFPLIIKPANMHNSIGIDNNAVVNDQESLARRLDYVINELKSVALVEEYVEGDEYNVSVIGNGKNIRVLPLSRTIFNYPEGMWHIHSFDTKWDHSSIAYNAIKVQRPPKGVSKSLLALITEVAIDAYNLFDCNDYARVEIKVDADNNPYLLEVNPNPSINIDDTILKSARLIGMDYADFLEEIIRNCIDRYRGKPDYAHLVGSMRY